VTNLNPTAENTSQTEATPDGVVGGTFRLDAMSPGAADSAPAEAAAAPRRGWKSTQSIALLVLVAAGGGIVYGMRQAGIGPMAAFATTKMPDYDVTKAPGSRTADHQRILKDLASTNITGQVPANQVQKNPFLLADLLGDEVAPVGEDQSAAQERARQERMRRDSEARRKMIESTLAGMKINGIMGADASGNAGVARINGDLYRVGEQVADTFTLKAIRPRSVELDVGGEVFTVSIDASNDPKGAKKKK